MFTFSRPKRAYLFGHEIHGVNGRGQARRHKLVGGALALGQLGQTEDIALGVHVEEMTLLQTPFRVKPVMQGFDLGRGGSERRIG